MKLVWFPQALSDLQQATNHIALDNPEAARKVAQRIYTAVDILIDHPHIGRPGRVPRTRELVITGIPFIVPYRVRGDDVELLDVIHTSRRWPETFE